MRDRTGVARVIPADLDRIAFGSFDRLDTRALGAADVADNVVTRHIRNGAVAWRHPDSDLTARRDIVDPELLEVLMGRDCREENSGQEGLGEHGEVDVKYVQCLACKEDVASDT